VHQQDANPPQNRYNIHQIYENKLNTEYLRPLCYR